MRRTEVSSGRLALILLTAVVGGVQVGLYAADWYDDGVTEPLSLWIGIAILIGSCALAAYPYLRPSGPR